MKTITIANHKGGVGKTSTALAIAQGLQLAGKKTLLVDLDPQCNLTFSCLNMVCETTNKELLDAERVRILPKPNTCKYRTFSLDVIASTEEIATMIDELEPTRLYDALAGFKGMYDYCIIDAPPSLNMLTINALSASSSVIIPVMCDAYSIQAVNQLKLTLHEVITSVNPFLTVLGILYNFYNPQTNLGKQCESSFNKLADELDTKVFETRIRRAQDIANCATSGYSVFEYRPNGRASIMYQNLVNEVIERTN